MAVSADTLHRAQRLRTAAVSELLADRYPLVHRLAHGLSGRVEVARRVVYSVMVRSLRVMEAWRDPTQAEHWFAHFTILMARRVPASDGRQDLFLEDGKVVDPPYLAFVRSLRSMPRQQQEAMLLHHAEKCDARGLAMAMDCSSDAATGHLRAAETQLRAVAGEQYEPFLSRLIAAYGTFTPTQELVLPDVTRVIHRRVWPRKFARAAAWLLLLGGIAAACWGGWWLYPRIEI